jgi:acyl transferase domain-containing protein/NAD(P)-dependent dehydrogenase (short-subunit alcohol dehydrogenase family)
MAERRVTYPSVPPVAVVGISALLPGPGGVDGFWRTVVAGRDMVTEVPPTHWLVDDHYDPDPAAPDRAYTKQGAFLSPTPFDPLAFGIQPNALAATDTSQLLALVAADRLLLSVAPEGLPAAVRERVSVIIGTSALELLTTMGARTQHAVWMRALRAAGVPQEQAEDVCGRIADSYVPWQEATLPGLLSNVVAGRIAKRYDLHGSNYTTDAACASSLAAISCAVNELAVGQADLVVAGGVDTLNDPVMYTCFSKTPVLSPTGDCRPFSAAADGIVLGEGIVLFALRRLADAERDGDAVYAVIRGIGSASDGRGGAIYAPMPSGQVRALRRAYEAAGFEPGTVGLIEAHGTGTIVGDAAEGMALRQAFTEAGRTDVGRCALGSVKSQIGHTKNAAGAAGMLKAVLALHHRVLPPTIKVERPNPRLELDGSPFYLNTHARPWIRDSRHPRRAGVSSFGFGGTDFHAVLEEYTGPSAAPLRVRTTRQELVLLSADTSAGLVAAARALAADGQPADARARQSQAAFSPDAPVRLALVAGGDLSAALESAAGRVAADPSTSFTGPGGLYYGAMPAEPGRVAFLFSGQGSQYVEMGAELAMSLPAAAQTWDAVGAIEFDGEPLHRVVFPPPAFSADDRDRQQAELTRTEWAQPALAAQSMAATAVLAALGCRPDAVAGHSFGELTALHTAGCFDQETFLRLARGRGELMRDASAHEGMMLAVAATAEQARSLLADVGDVWIANRNAPRQVVVSGTRRAVNAFARLAEAAGHTTTQLDTSRAFHSPLVAGAVGPFREVLAGVDVRPPQIAVYSNAYADTYPDDPDAIRDRLAAQLEDPVRFVDMIEAMYADGVRTFVEVGARGTLARLVGEVLADRDHLAVAVDRPGDGMGALYMALAQLAVGGLRLELAALWEPFGAFQEQLQATGRTVMTMDILGANYGKPYPPSDGSTGPTGKAASAPAVPSPAVPSPAVPSPAVAAPAPPSLTSSPPPPPPPPPPAPAPAPPPPPASAADDAWMAALRHTQQLAAEAHLAYQRAMSESHLAFLRLAETALTGLAGGTASAVAEFRAPPVPVLAPSAPMVQAPPPMSAPPMSAKQAAPVPVKVPAESRDPLGDSDVTASTGAVGPGLDELLAVVAYKTGYPVEVLDPAMELEADLGIDSIKRVEILAEISHRFPALPQIDSGTLGTAVTLAEIVGLMGTGPAQPTTAVGPADEPLLRLAALPVPAPAAGLALPGLLGCRVAVIDGGSGLAAALVGRLGTHGVAAVEAAASGDAEGVIHLGGLAPDPMSALAVIRDVFRTARGFDPDRGGVFVVVQDTGGDFGPSAPARAAFAGLAASARTLTKEWPAVSVKAIDCPTSGRDPETVAEAIERELLTGGSSTDVGLTTSGVRTILRVVPAPAGDPDAGALAPGAVVVVSGGARGITAAAVRALAAAQPLRIVLLGRSELLDEPAYLQGVDGKQDVYKAVTEHLRANGAAEPRLIREQATAFMAAREIRETLAAVREAGSSVRYLRVDVTDREAVAAALDAARAEWGPVTGLIHGAGVIADRKITEKTDEQFDVVFGTKVTGLANLLAAVSSDPLRLLCVFSSVAARYGNPGQCDYAAANEVAARIALAEGARRPGLRVRVLSWGLWAGGMVDESLVAHFQATGTGLIKPTIGAQAFVDELRAPAGPGEVVLTAGPSAPSETPRLTGDLMVSPRQLPFLADHRIAGAMVVPVAMVVEWFIAALAAVDAGSPAVLAGLEVLRKIDISDEQILRLTAERRGASVVLSLHGSGGVPHYRASSGSPSDLGPSIPSLPRLQPLDRDIYDGRVLFHGPAFQVLQAVHGLSDAGALAVTTGARERAWPPGPWCTDPAAVDGALQLATLWAERRLGRAVLPMGMDRFTLLRPGLIDGPAQVHVRAGATAEGSADCTVHVSAATGEPLFVLDGVRLIARPDVPRG